jgi:hypothetical protein
VQVTQRVHDAPATEVRYQRERQQNDDREGEASAEGSFGHRDS